MAKIRLEVFSSISLTEHVSLFPIQSSGWGECRTDVLRLNQASPLFLLMGTAR